MEVADLPESYFDIADVMKQAHYPEGAVRVVVTESSFNTMIGWAFNSRNGFDRNNPSHVKMRRLVKSRVYCIDSFQKQTLLLVDWTLVSDIYDHLNAVTDIDWAKSTDDASWQNVLNMFASEVKQKEDQGFTPGEEVVKVSRPDTEGICRIPVPLGQRLPTKDKLLVLRYDDQEAGSISFCPASAVWDLGLSSLYAHIDIEDVEWAEFDGSNICAPKKILQPLINKNANEVTILRGVVGEYEVWNPRILEEHDHSIDFEQLLNSYYQQ